MGLRCKGCGSEAHIKNGFMRGKQRYRCKACGLNFTDTPPRGLPLALKATAVLLYVSSLSMNTAPPSCWACPPRPSKPGSSSSPRSTPRSPRRKAGRW
jgi:uncharacterized protein (DUF983 family)